MKKRTVPLILTSAILFSMPTYASIEDVESYFSDASDYDYEVTISEYGSALNIVDIFDLTNFEYPDPLDKSYYIFSKLSEMTHEPWFDYKTVQVTTYSFHENTGVKFFNFKNINVGNGTFQYEDYSNQGCGIIKTEADMSDTMISGIRNCVDEILNARMQNVFAYSDTENLEVEWFGTATTGIFANVTGYFEDSDNEKRYDYNIEFTFATSDDGATGSYSEVYSEINDVVLFGEYVRTFDYHLTEQ